jgi:hypothetical protein
MRQRQHLLSRALVLLAILQAATRMAVRAQVPPPGPCVRVMASARLLDSVDTQLGRLDRHWGSTGGSRSTSCAVAHLDRDSVLIVALAGDDERTGGIAVLAPGTHSILYVYTYPAAREISAAGNRRVTFTYTSARELFGAGIYESDYLVLCAVGREMWLPCLKFPRDHIENVLATPTPMRFEEHNIAAVVGDSVYFKRRVVFWIDGVRDSTAQQLGTTVLALPQLP